MNRPLDTFPQPSVSVDVAVLTVADDHRLSVVLLPSRGTDLPVRLPGTFLHEGELLVEAVTRVLADKAGIRGLAPRQLRVFDGVHRDDRGRVLSVAHVDVVREESLPPGLLVVPVDALPRLAFDHDRIVAHAVDVLRAQYRERPDPAGLLEAPFTLRRLRAVHEAVAAQRLQPDTFRRAMLPYLTETGGQERSGRGRPAALYRPMSTGASMPEGDAPR